MDKWLDKYEIAKQYYNEHQDLLVPDKFMYKNINLGNWIYWQRKNYKDNKLSSDKINLLNNIGMVWNALPDYDEIWDNYYKIACDFKNEFNTLVIPTNYTYKDCNIGKWISHQRQRYKKGKMSNAQINQLESIGMIWDASNNNISTSFPEQAIFFYIKKIFKDAINRYNDLGFELDIFIPSINTAIEYDGFLWHKNNKNDISKNNKCIKHGIFLIRVREDGLENMNENKNVKILNIKRGYSNLQDVIIQILKILNVNEDVGIDLQNDSNEIIKNYINVYNNQWKEMFDKAKKYYKDNNRLIINIDDAKIDSWISHQRQRYFGRKNPLTQDQVEKLESIGMVWDVYDSQWEDSYKIAKEYYRENNDLIIKNSCVFNDFNLGSWISSQRNMYKNNNLSNDRIKKLEKIGMIWDASIDADKIWNDHYIIAKQYYEEHGNLLINTRSRYKGDNLGAWINKNRNEKDKLSNDKINKLESIGMVWNVHHNKWYSNYELLKEYYNKNGNILVPFDYEQNGFRLGEWLKRQMGNHDKLSEEQVQLLEKLGIVWERNSSKWDYMYSIAEKYYHEYGDLMVNTHSMYLNEKLGYWINHQRDDYQKQNTKQANINFTKDRIKKLESIGMIWDVSSYLWISNYSILKDYYEENGNIDIPSSFEYKGVKIGKWLQNQKSSFRGYKGRKKLTNEQIDKLNDLNIKW